MRGKQELEKFTKKYPLPLSQGQVNTIDNCSLKWWFDYVMKYRKHTQFLMEHVTGHGKSFHKYTEDGFNDMILIEDEVDMFGGVDTDDNPIPDEYIDGLYFIEDWMNQLWSIAKENNQSFAAMHPFRVEWWIQSPPEKVDVWKNVKDGKTIIHEDFLKKDEHPPLGECDCEYVGSVWIKRIGVVDIAWRLPDGSLFLWDIKTGNSSDWATNKALRQLYYYKKILENMGHKVFGIGVIFPHDGRMVTREDRTVSKDEENVSRLSKQSMESVEKLLKKSFLKLFTVPITPEYSEWFCVEYCNYSNDELLLCNFEPQDLSKYHTVENREQLLDLVLL